MRRTLTEMVVLAALAGGIFYLLGRWDQAIDAREAELRASIEQALESGAAYRALHDSLDALEDSILATVSVRDSTLAAQRDRVRVAELEALEAKIQPVCQPVVNWANELQRQVVLLEAQTVDLRLAYRAAQQRADSSHTRALVLEGLLEERERLGRCKILGFINCPSRTTAAVLGAVGGALGVMVVISAVQ